MSVKFKIYNNSPIFIQNALITIQGAIYKRQRFTMVYKERLQELKKRDYSNLEQLKSVQNKQTVEFIRFAFRNSKFYNVFYKDIDLSEINSVDDLHKLPVLEKDILRSHLKELYTIKEKNGIIHTTSGTTGTPMKVVFTKNDRQRRLAYLDFFKFKHGFVNLKHKRASFNEARIISKNHKKNIFWRDNFTVKQRIYSAFYCQENNLSYYVENLNKYKPHSLDGYPSAIFQIADYIIKNNIKLDFTPIAIFPTAEVLLPHYRNTIQQAFNCQVYDQYASSEGAPFIIECEEGNLHYCMDTGVIETEDNGDMLVTSFETHGTPLIRYRIGDKLRWGENSEKCKCGNSMPIVGKIEGRTNEYLTCRNGKRYTSLYFAIESVRFQNSVKLMQFEQNALDEIIVRIVKDKNYDPIEMNQIIIDKLNYMFGDDMRITFDFVDSIPKDKSGKYRLIINNITQDVAK